MQKTVDAQDIEKFKKDSAHWWDEEGPFAPLHKMNPVRLQYIQEKITQHFGKDSKSLKALDGLSVIDIGCGGGLVCEPLHRMGAKTTGLDADDQAIEVAKEHAEKAGLDITYKAIPAEEETKTYDVVLALEIAEHVSDLESFVGHCARLCKPGGLVIISTLNRTPQSFMLGIVAAEYILRWVPRGTHDWKKFIKPSELTSIIRKNSLCPKEIKGIAYSPLEKEFKISDKDVSVNYFITAEKK